MRLPGVLGHLTLAVVGTALLLDLSRPIAFRGPLGASTDLWGWIAAILGLAVIATGAIAGTLDGNLLHLRTHSGLVMALVFDAVLLVPLWWVAALVLLFLQSADDIEGPCAGSRVESVLVPVGAWLLGVLLLHLVSLAVVGELDRAIERGERLWGRD